MKHDDEFQQQMERAMADWQKANPVTGKCACGADAYRGEQRCEDCAENERRARSRRSAALHAWQRTIPGRYVWCRGFSVPELAVRVRDAAAVAKAKAIGAAFDRIAFIGSAGVGKTVLACTILHVVASGGTEPLFVEARDLATARAQHGLGEGEAPLVREAIDADVVVIDDLGSETLTPQSAIADVLHERHAWARPTITTVALGIDGTKSRYGDGVARRVFEGAHLIEVRKGGTR